MKKIIRPVVILLISLTLAFASAAFSRAGSIQRSTGITEYPGAAFFFQTTATPELNEDRSEIGSTDGLTIMGFVIVAIIVIPIVLKRKDWSHT